MFWCLVDDDWSVAQWLTSQSTVTMQVSRPEKVNFAPIAESKFWWCCCNISSHGEPNAPAGEIRIIMDGAHPGQAPLSTMDRWRHPDITKSKYCKHERRYHRRSSETHQREVKDTALTFSSHLNDSVCEADRNTNPDDTETLNFPNLYSRDKCGTQLLSFWKSTAGKSKSWRRLPGSTTPPYKERGSKDRCRQYNAKKCSSQALSLPETFLRAHQGRLHPLIRYVTQYHTPSKRQKQDRLLDYGCICDHSETDLLWEDQKIETQDPTNSTHQTIDQDDQLEPENIFIRLTWDGRDLANVHEHLGRSLPRGLQFRNGWCLGSFIRDESFTDVYSVSQETDVSCHNVELDLEAHVFTTRYDGHSESYARRHKNRLRKSGNCLDTFWYNDQHVFIMSVPQGPDTFRLRNNESEFPCWINEKVWAEKLAKRQRGFRGRPSYASVLQKPSMEHVVTGLAQEFNTVFARDMARTSLVTAKRRQKQWSKRQAQRASKSLQVESHGG